MFSAFSKCCKCQANHLKEEILHFIDILHGLLFQNFLKTAKKLRSSTASVLKQGNQGQFNTCLQMIDVLVYLSSDRVLKSSGLNFEPYKKRVHPPLLSFSSMHVNWLSPTELEVCLQY